MTCRRCRQPIVLMPSGSWAHPKPLTPGWFPHYPVPLVVAAESEAEKRWAYGNR